MPYNVIEWPHGPLLVYELVTGESLVADRPLMHTAGRLLFASTDKADASAPGWTIGNQEAPWPPGQS